MLIKWYVVLPFPSLLSVPGYKLMEQHKNQKMVLDAGRIVSSSAPYRHSCIY